MHEFLDILNHKSQFYQRENQENHVIVVIRDGFSDDNYFYFLHQLSRRKWKWCAVQRETGLVVWEGNGIEDLAKDIYLRGIHEDLLSQRYTDEYINDCKIYDQLLRHEIVKENFG